MTKYQNYIDEIDRLQAEVSALKKKNKALRKKLAWWRGTSNA